MFSNLTLALLILGLVALVCLSGVIYLAAHAMGVPDVLVATTGAAIGSIGSILVVSPRAP